MTTAADVETPAGTEPPEPPDERAASPPGARFARLLPLARSRWAPALLVAVAPVLILVVLRVSPYFRLNNGDPFIYVGYANDFRGHVVRFGYTYYSVRWGLIFPMRAALAFGPVWGYFILRYLLYELALIPLYFALRPYGRRVAMFGVVVFVATPVTAQSILSTYQDTIAVPVLTAIASLLVIASRTRGLRMVGLCAVCGCLAGVAVNASLFFVPFAGLAIGVLCVMLLWQRRVGEMFAAGMTFVVGIVGVSAVGVLVYNALFSDPDIYETSLNAMNDISGEASWRSPSLDWLETRRFVYAPFVVLGVAIIALVRRRHVPLGERRPFLTAFVIASGTLALFAIHQFLLEGNSMEQAYYFSYVAGPMCLLLAAAVGELTAEARRPGLVLLVAPVLLAFLTQLFELKYFWMFVLVAVALVAVMARGRTVAAVVLPALVVMHVAWGAGPRVIPRLAAGTFQYDPHYEIVFGDGDDTAFEAYVLANELTTVVPTEGAIRRPVLFWYPSGDAMLDSVQASYLWEVSTVQRSPAPGLPDLAPDDLARIDGIITGYVVMMSRTPDRIEAGLANLRAAGYGLEVVREEPLSYDDSTVLTLTARVVSGRA